MKNGVSKHDVGKVEFLAKKDTQRRGALDNFVGHFCRPFKDNKIPSLEGSVGKIRTTSLIDKKNCEFPIISVVFQWLSPWPTEPL